MLNFLKRVFGDCVAWLKQYFTSGRAAEDMAWALSHIRIALPVIDQAAKIGTRVLTPNTQVDDIAWDALVAAYPAFFDGSLKTDEEFKLALLGVATELFKAKFPTIDTTKARMTVQAAYAEYKASHQSQ